MSSPKHGCKLMFYRYLSVEELYAAIDMLKWFEEEAMSGKSKFDSKKKEWIKDPNLPLPSWKHLTRGGHGRGMNIQRGAIGVHVRASSQRSNDLGGLIFRRHSRDQRIFVVQRSEDLEMPRDMRFRLEKKECMCKECVGDVKVKTKLKMEDLQLYKEL